jgi:2-methylcitrate dehydratase
MTHVEQLATFVTHTSYSNISEAARQALKIRVLDALGCAIGALEGPPIRAIRALTEEFGGNPLATLIGGGKTSPDRAAFYNAALVRYLDFNDSYLTKGETFHPNDNVGAVLAASEYADKSGKELLTSLAVAYQVQARLSEAAPVRAHGFDHTTQGAYAVAAGVSRALSLNSNQTANALAISGTALNALRVTRTGQLSNWKGLAYPYTVFGATQAAFLAKYGITGPLEVFEGNKGFMDSIAGQFSIDWSREDLEAVLRSSIKKYNAEFHSQSALEGILELRAELLRATHHLSIEQIERIDVSIFDVAYNIIGGGEEGDKQRVRTKEEADHSLPYMLAVALLDGEVMPAQYEPERIVREDVQTLLRKISIHPGEGFSRRFPQEMPCYIRVRLTNGQVYEIEKRDFEGFYTRPLTWEGAVAKFEKLAAPYTSADQRQALVDAIHDLDSTDVRVLTALLATVGRKNT